MFIIDLASCEEVYLFAVMELKPLRALERDEDPPLILLRWLYLEEWWERLLDPPFTR